MCLKHFITKPESLPNIQISLCVYNDLFQFAMRNKTKTHFLEFFYIFLGLPVERFFLGFFMESGPTSDWRHYGRAERHPGNNHLLTPLRWEGGPGCRGPDQIFRYIILRHNCLHYLTLSDLTLPYIILHVLHYLTLHYITLHYITLHYSFVYFM